MDALGSCPMYLGVWSAPEVEVSRRAATLLSGRACAGVCLWSAVPTAV